MHPLSYDTYPPPVTALSTYAPFLDRLKIIYSTMDRKYQEASDYYGFKCTGCEDNCCFTHFYHYTLVEYLYIREGFKELAVEEQTDIKGRALDVCRKSDGADEQGISLRLMCPLNCHGLCRLYAYRPMICRLHGIPHELQRPGQGILHAPGCEVFNRQCHGKKRFKFDRTPFYTDMARLEGELKQVIGIAKKIKMTISEMITTFCDGY